MRSGLWTGSMALMTERSIFYHVPKTGGTWVARAMANAGVECRNASVRKMRHPLAPMIGRTHAAPACVREADKEGRFSFCFIREPLEWYRSFWCEKRRARKKAWWLEDTFFLGFEDWVNRMLDERPGFVTELYGHFVGQVHFVGRTEALSDDLARALELAGEEYDLDALVSTEKANAAGQEKELATLSAATTFRLLEAECDAVEWWRFA